MRKKDATPIARATRRVSKQDLTTLRRQSRESQVAALRERKKEGSRRICRGRVRWN